MKASPISFVVLLLALTAPPAQATNAWPFSGGGLANARDAAGGVGDPVKMMGCGH
ncbi:MAG TPA: hypothetical protein VKZ79_19720 [Alphaproteobacteria bacterium]|nr:hypothetical protein [Alphaproteobacteria bacterium]